MSCIKCGRAGVFLLVPMLMRVRKRVLCAPERLARAVDLWCRGHRATGFVWCTFAHGISLSIYISQLVLTSTDGEGTSFA